jgi:hypothetical protein
MLAVSTSSALGFASTPMPDCPEPVVVKEELGFNPCAHRHSFTELAGFANSACFDEDGNPGVGPQAGADITEGAAGLMSVEATQHPILGEYADTALCPVNVHWHMGAEHRSAGEYDEYGKSPEDHHRRLAESSVRHGHKCMYYDETDPKFTTEYDWKYCKDMVVGETYEIHWPHSAAGACGTKWQYQSKFYDGVFCNMDAVMGVLGMATEEAGAPVPTYIGVQGQVFTIVNDDAYKLDLNMAGAIMGGEYWSDVARYTGSTTGTSRDNEICSNYAPITWQVDRKCHMIAASSFDALCKEMKNNKEEKGGDDMEHDLHAHGARETVWANLTAGTPGR